MTQDGDSVVQITEVEVGSEKAQTDVLRLMAERARFMEAQPGFLSITLHRSLDGKRVINCIKWRDASSLHAAHTHSRFRKGWRHFGDMAEEIDPHLYEIFDYREGGRSRILPVRQDAAGGRQTLLPKAATDDSVEHAEREKAGAQARERSRVDRRTPGAKAPTQGNRPRQGSPLERRAMPCPNARNAATTMTRPFASS